MRSSTKIGLLERSYLRRFLLRRNDKLCAKNFVKVRNFDKVLTQDPQTTRKYSYENDFLAPIAVEILLFFSFKKIKDWNE